MIIASKLLPLGLCLGLSLGCTGSFAQAPAPPQVPGTSAPATPGVSLPTRTTDPSMLPPGATPAAPDASAQPEQPEPSPDAGTDYVLGPEDAIHVTVWKEPSLTGALIVRPDGKISLPLVGDEKAAGLTPMQLAAQLKIDLKKFINDPTVTVTVTGVNSKRIFFTGEVNRQGPISLSRSMTLVQAIAQAGGLTPYANKKHLIIERGDPPNQQRLKFDYSKALKTGDEQGIKLMPGDTIVVR